MKRIVLFFAMIAALTAPFADAAEKPLIISTIKPVHAIVNAIAGDTTESVQMVPDYASPHHYSLKPSDIRRLGKATLVFRIDPKMEAQLNKSFSTIDQDKLLVLSQTKGIELLEAGHSHSESSHAEESHEQQDAHDGHDGHDGHDDHEEDDKHEDHESHNGDNAHASHEEHDDAEKDYHLWLDPHNAAVMTDAIRDALIKALPENADQYQANAKKLKEAIQLADTEITEQLASVTDQPYLVMHDAWQYFTKHYKLKQLGSITQQEGLKASGKALSDARALIQESGVSCIVTEPGVKIRTLAVLTEDLDVNTTEIDPLGRAIPLTDQTYPELLRYTATQLANCLKPKS